MVIDGTEYDYGIAECSLVCMDFRHFNRYDECLNTHVTVDPYTITFQNTLFNEIIKRCKTRQEYIYCMEYQIPHYVHGVNTDRVTYLQCYKHVWFEIPETPVTVA